MPTARRSTTRQSHPIDDAKAVAGQQAREFHANGGKTYESINQATVQRLPFNIKVFRNGLPEIHGFTAAPVMDLGSVLLYLRGDEDSAGQAMLRLVTVNLDDSDGVPADWQPTMLPKPKSAGADWVPKFRAPGAPHGDGKLHTMDQAHRWTDRDAGSSRRRWNYLMFEDPGVVVTIEVLREVIEDLMAAAAGHPTDGS
jgi:hypothetical protein